MSSSNLFRLSEAGDFDDMDTLRRNKYKEKVIDLNLYDKGDKNKSAKS